ncbi:MAG: hypothetical protein FWD13_09150 [Treponema sp.]|nr:hypothetical protein [Treponema sp.]
MKKSMKYTNRQLYPTHIGGGGVVLLSLLLVLCFVSCEIDHDYLFKLDEEVRWHNAAKLNIRLEYPTRWGTSNPQQGLISPGVRDIRLGYETNFTIEFTPDTNFSLDSWVAYYTSSITVDALGGNWLEDISLLNSVESINKTDAVLPVNPNPNGGSFTFRVNTAEPVTLIPWCNPAPRVIRTEPRSNAPEQIISRASDIVIYFTIPLDPSPANIKFADSAESDGIWITANGVNINNNYKTPVYSSENGFYTITIFPTNELPPAGSEITVTIRGIKNSSGSHKSGYHEFTWITSRIIPNNTAEVKTWEAGYEKDNTGVWVINYSWTSSGADRVVTYYRINNGSKIFNTDEAFDPEKPKQNAVIENVPVLNASGVRSGTAATVTEYEIIIELYTDNIKSSVKSFNIWNVPGMANNSVNPLIEINSSEQLVVSNEQLNKNYLLTSDITLTNHVPIGTASAPFTGKFYGNGYTITIESFASTGSATDYGLFGVVGGNAVIHDLTVLYEAVGGGVVIINPTVAARFGGLTGTIQGNARLENVLVKGAANVNFANFNNYAGGLAGLMTGTSSIYNVFGDLDLTMGKPGSSNSLYVGGLTGSMGRPDTGDPVRVEEVSVVGNITVGTENNPINVVSTSDSYVGLFVGGLTGFIRGTDTYNRAVLQRSYYRQGSITIFAGTGTSILGGAVGRVYGQSNIIGCDSLAGSFFIGKSRTTGSGQFFVGGFLGDFFLSGTLEACYSNNLVDIIDITAVSSGVSVSVGGFAGRTNANISYCYAFGDVSVTSYSTFCVGGFVGSGDQGSISNSYATGNVNAYSFGGGAIVYAGGFAGTGANYNNCYALGDVFVDKLGFGALMAGGFLGLAQAVIGDGIIQNCFSVGKLIVQRSDDGPINVGGFVGINLYTNNFTLQNNAVLGVSITATGPGTKNIGRVWGIWIAASPVMQNNHAFNGMQLLTHTTTGATSGFTTVTPVNNANEKDGADLTVSVQHTRSFWRETLGFNPDHWIFGTVDTRGYPILRGPDVGFEPGPAMAGQ